MPSAPDTGSIPPDILAELEQRLPSALADHLTYSCTIRALGPNAAPATREIKGSGRLYCTGTGVSQVKIAVAIQRHRYLNWWVNVVKGTSPWLPGNAITMNRRGSCASGTHTYRVVADGWIRLVNDQVKHYKDKSGSLRTDCEY